ncbi:MAG TPA: anthranilate phosphoribosyltransferase [Candidatus Binataceae bacterium]|nr:anthranilate phosphoribosyltransferase [Candidatus Binataceae bacterium]
MSSLRDAMTHLLAGRSLSEDEAVEAFGDVLDARAPDVLVAGFLVALRINGESAAELAGAARAMLARARPLDLGNPLLDTAGTGGDNAGTVNISTGAALIAAAVGVRVAKHGNRAISGRIGAADLLERMGVRIDLDPAGLRHCLDQSGICFVFAPAYHPVMARLAILRRELGIRTLFNLLGPLVNPSRPSRQLLGVAEPRLMRPMVEALASLGVDHAMVVHGEDGLDEISCIAPTRVAELRGGKIDFFQIEPERFGMRREAIGALATSGPDHAVEVLHRALAGEGGVANRVLALNAGAAIYLGGKAPTLEAGIAQAGAILAEGKALEVLERMRRASQEESA